MIKEDLIKDINNLEIFIIEDKDKGEDFDDSIFIKMCLVNLFNTQYPPKVLDIQKFRCKNIFADMYIVRLRVTYHEEEEDI